MKLRSAGLLIISGLLAVCLGCDFLNPPKKPKKEEPVSRPQAKGTVIATVNNMPVTLEDLNEEIAGFNAMVPEEQPENKVTTREQKVNYLKESLVRQMLLYQEGLRRGIDRKDDVLRVLEKTKQQAVLLELGKDLINNIEVTSKEIEEYYNNFKDQLKAPEERRIREIVVTTEAEAKDVLIQLLQGGDFAALAKERSKAASSRAGGDLGFLTAGKKFQKFDELAFSDSLEIGRVSSIFKGPDGWYILKLEQRRGGEQKPLSEVWDNIKNGLLFLKQQQAIEDLVGKLSREAKIEIYEGEIK
ncbi:MAG: peptidyl-prolyl cis-trans isomerase [Candidatus Omnitrophota bacterium]